MLAVGNIKATSTRSHHSARADELALRHSLGYLGQSGLPLCETRSLFLSVPTTDPRCPRLSTPSFGFDEVLWPRTSACRHAEAETPSGMHHRNGPPVEPSAPRFDARLQVPRSSTPGTSPGPFDMASVRRPSHHQPGVC
jgi:hypothetical protein